jgi:hypothetical protein
MIKAYILTLISIFFLGSWAVATETEPFKNDSVKYDKKEDLLNNIESLLANHQDFIDAIKSKEIQYREVSPSSVANYMEAFANEGMLKRIPTEYLKHDGIKEALYVVFEDNSNISNNRNFYDDHFKRIRNKDLQKDIERLLADHNDFIDTIKSK